MAHRDQAMRRLYAASVERDRRRTDYEAAIGTSFEDEARALLREAAEHLAACRRLADNAKSPKTDHGQAQALSAQP
jgi:hypothetical protein